MRSPLLRIHLMATILASGSEDKTIRLWDVSTRETIAILEGHTHWVTSVAYSPDGDNASLPDLMGSIQSSCGILRRKENIADP